MNSLKINNGLMGLIVGVLIILLSSVNISALTDSPVTLQVQMVLGTGGALINGTKDVSIRLSYETNGEEVVMWERVYANEVINSGALIVSLSGDDDQGRELSIEMFDEEGVQLVVDVDGFEAELDLISQPYAIKSNISDEAHSALGLQGIPIRDVIDLEDGDMLIARDGEWVATGASDGLTGLGSAYEGAIHLTDIVEVDLTGVEMNQILKYDGTNWINSNESVLTESDIADVADEKGFLQEVDNSVMVEGEYDNILGIGGKISVNPNVNIDDDVDISGDLKVTGDVLVWGTLGRSGMAISDVYASSVNIGAVIISENNGNLKVSEAIEIDSQNGTVITGTGQVNRMAIYEGVNEIGEADSVIWDATKAQVGIGSISELSGVRLNVEGVLRASEGLVVGTTELTLDEYVVTSDLAVVSFTGSYDDLTVKPDLSVYIDEVELQSELSTNYYTQTEVASEITDQISEYDQSVMVPYVANELTGYYTKSEVDSEIGSELSNYYTKSESDGQYVTPDDVDTSLSDYATESKIRNEILSTYVTVNAISTVGYTGEYIDILNVPNLLLQSDFDSFENTVTSNYATMVYMENRISAEVGLETSAVLAEVDVNYTDNNELKTATDNLYALHVETLHEVARTGSFYDLDDYPDLGLYYLKTEIHEKFVSMNELVVTLGAYIKHIDVSEVGKTGDWEDIIGAPVITDYQLVSDMNDYVTETEMASAISGVSGGGGSVDMTSYATKAYVTTSLGSYIEDGALATVAETGSYNDLIDTETVITSSDLEVVLEDYVLNSGLSEGLGSELAGYVDDEALADELNALRAEVTSSRNSDLADYYIQSNVNSQIASALDDYQADVMSVSINTEISSALEDYLTVYQLEVKYVSQNYFTSELSNALESYITTYNLESELLDYVKAVSVNSMITDIEDAMVTVESYSDIDQTVTDLLIFFKGDDAITGNIGFMNNVSIGGTGSVFEPQEALEVYGNTTISGGLTATEIDVVGDATFTGSVTASEFMGDGSNLTGVDAIPPGLISMWSGTIANIPEGWVLCDGTNNTPDLRGRFVVGYSGSGDYASIGNTGGSDSRTLTTSNMPSHNHSGSIGARDTNHTHSGTSGNNNQNHSHTMNSGGSHSHGINTFQDDWNDSGGIGPSWGDGDNGTNAAHHSTAAAGSHSHGMNNQTANHDHSFTTGTESSSHSHSLSINNSGSGTAFDNRPSYYVVAFIMKE